MKKVPIIHFVGLFVPVLLLAQSAFADAAGDLKQAEGLYKAGKYAEAEQVYRTILQGAANDPEAVYQAGKMLPQVCLATDRLAEAQAAMQQLLTRSAANEWLPHALHEIIEQAKALNRTSQAGQICQNILTAQPDHPQAIWLRMGVVIANVYVGNNQAVDAGVQDIVANNSADRWAGEGLAQIGWAYDKLGQYDKARPLYEYVVDHWPDKPRVIFAHTALVRGCIRLNDKQAAQTRLQQLVSRYVQDTHLPNVLNEIARGYREARMYQEAKPVSQYVLDHYPDSDQRIWADRDILLCDIRLYNQDAAQTEFQKLISRYAENGYLPYVLVDISGQYRQVRLYSQARSASQYVLDHYSDSDQCLWPSAMSS
jgi:tetratricopeptide (TPR) repeat protein